METQEQFQSNINLNDLSALTVENAEVQVAIAKIGQILNQISALANKNLREYAEIKDEVQEAKSFIEIFPEVKDLLEKFQKKEQEKLVQNLEVLLTAILQDVIITDDDGRQVKFEISSERGSPAIDISIDKNEQGKLEDPYSGAGGAVSNVLSLGLRVIALLQSNHRKFLVLDEPDCWIGEDNIPTFIKVINSISEQTGIQILVISHHKEMFTEGVKHSLVLSKQNGVISANWAANSEIPEWESEEQEGIRSVLLENFQSHERTFLPLAPTVTLITGVNDLGKSSIVSALRSVFYGEGRDSNIRHTENETAEETKVTIAYENNNVLIWSRKMKGSPKEQYVLIDGEHGLSNPKHASQGAKNVPEWLFEEIKIGYIEGFDVQLGHQKKPVFLLDEPPSRKAKALSIGDQSEYIFSMMDIAKKDLSEKRLIVKNGEEKLQNLYSKIRLYNHYKDELEKQPAFIIEKVKKINALTAKKKEITELMMKFDLLVRKKEILNTAKSEEITQDLNEEKILGLKSKLNSFRKYLNLIDRDIHLLNFVEEQKKTKSIDLENTLLQLQIVNKSDVVFKDFLTKKIKQIKLLKANVNLDELNVSTHLTEKELLVQISKINVLYSMLPLLEKKLLLSQNEHANINVENISTLSQEIDIGTQKSKLLNRLVKLFIEKREMEERKEQIVKEQEKISFSIQKDFPVCPVCLNPTNFSHIHH